MHIMIDLETMGTRPDAPIVSIGAVAFNGAGIANDFYRNVDLKTSVAGGGVIDPDTLMWWLRQDNPAREALTDAAGIALTYALHDLAMWFPNNLSGVWGNGASFDNVILSESFIREGVEQPWPFWKDKCYRTVKGMYPDVALERSGTHHNALDDARTQAEHLIAINAAAGGIIL